jgi:hypothetical protein
VLRSGFAMAKFLVREILVPISEPGMQKPRASRGKERKETNN